MVKKNEIKTISEEIKIGLTKTISAIHMQLWTENKTLSFGEVSLEAMYEIKSSLELLIEKKERQLSEIGGQKNEK